MSEKFVILVYPTCDISDSLHEEFDIEMIKGHFVLADGSEHVSISNWDTLDREEFYKNLKKTRLCRVIFYFLLLCFLYLTK